MRKNILHIPAKIIFSKVDYNKLEEVLVLDNLSKTFEQYCCVKGHNVAVEEITFPDGTKIYRCAMQSLCKECNNEILKTKFTKKEKEKNKD